MFYQTDHKKIEDIYRKMSGTERFDLFKKIIRGERKQGKISKEKKKELDDIIDSFRDVLLLERQTSDKKEKSSSQMQLIIFLRLFLGSVIRDSLVLQLLLIETILEATKFKMVSNGLALGIVKIQRIIKESKDKEEIEKKVEEFIQKQTKGDIELYGSIKDAEGFDDLVTIAPNLINLISSLDKQQKDLGFFSPEIIKKLTQNSVLLKYVLPDS